MMLRDTGCRACMRTTSGDCGGHGRITIPDTYPPASAPTSLTAQEQTFVTTMEVQYIGPGARIPLVADLLLIFEKASALIRRLDARVVALTTITPGDLNRLPCGCWQRACSVAHEYMLSQRDDLARAIVEGK